MMLDRLYLNNGCKEDSHRWPTGLLLGVIGGQKINDAMMAHRLEGRMVSAVGDNLRCVWGGLLGGYMGVCM